MDFRYSQDILDLRDGARKFLEAENTSARLRQIAKGDDPLSLWPKLSEMGLLGLCAPETAGGLELEAADALLFCEEAGRSALPEPYSEVATLLIPALEKLGKATDIALSDIVAGTLRGVVRHPLNPYPNLADQADFVLAFRPGKVLLSSKEEFQISPLESIDPGRRLSNLSLTMGRVIADGRQADDLSAEIAARGACAAAAELCGLAARMIELATEYSRTREQFGKPIGSFQAVKHLMANAQVRLEFARPVVYRAGTLLEKNTVARDVAVSHAKIAASDAAMLAAENAIQVFGGMGYTFEVDLHFFMKRVWALCGIWGDRSHHCQIIDASLTDPRTAIGPGETFS